ncbi:MAG: N-acetyl-gamma-glutamyl-phosphate reductase [Rickettsiales bacterium]|nr:N-acetyl-gamma-glutamyl-phosphate reductase [Rickettsiales bacterium]
MTKTLKTVILGASGYTGAELLRLIPAHPAIELVALTGDSQAGKTIGEVYPHLRALNHTLVKHETVDYSNVDLVFCCLPHGTTQEILAGLPEHIRIVDLSADFRLFDMDDYAHWYGHAHLAPALQEKAVYGLSEIYRDQIKQTRLLANPGCYPTSILLPLIPLLKTKLIEASGITVDSMSGVSGAGRKVAQNMLFCEVNESAKAYGVGGHRHVAEIEQECASVSGVKDPISFTAHLVPMSRGMSSTIHVSLADGVSADQLHDALREQYQDEAFVHVNDMGVVSSTKEVLGTNECRICVSADRVAGKAIIVSVIDNLVKGASGQALQNMNIMFGFEETLGLQHSAVFP